MSDDERMAYERAMEELRRDCERRVAENRRVCEQLLAENRRNCERLLAGSGGRGWRGLPDYVFVMAGWFIGTAIAVAIYSLFFCLVHRLAS